MDMGPVEYLVIAFPGNKFSGKIVPALADLVDSGTVRILDLVFVSKDEDGNVASFEYDELEAAVEEALGYDAIDGEVGGLLGEDDLDEAGELLEPGSSAAVLVWEDVWAKSLASAIRDADGQLVAGGRISHESIAELLAAIEEA